MDRRASIYAFTCGLTAAAFYVNGAPIRRIFRIGVLCANGENLSLFVRALQTAGYEDGRTAEIIFKRWDKPEQSIALADELVAAKVDVIAAASVLETRAAKHATSTIPIVMMYGLAPVELGLIASLARPGGNVTGTVAVPIELVAKSVEIFRNTLPHLRRLTILLDDDPWAPVFLLETERAAQAMGIATQSLQIRTPADMKKVFSELRRYRPDGITVCHSLWPYDDEIVRFAASQKLPAIYGVIPAVRHGGFMAVAPDLPSVYVRTASIIDRILNGVRPADIPVEQPTLFILAINQTAAKRLEITIPYSVLVSANVVFQ